MLYTPKSKSTPILVLYEGAPLVDKEIRRICAENEQVASDRSNLMETHLDVSSHPLRDEPVS